MNKNTLLLEKAYSGAVASASLGDAMCKTKYFALYLAAFFFDELCLVFYFDGGRETKVTAPRSKVVGNN